jgi:hypothetical protein
MNSAKQPPTPNSIQSQNQSASIGIVSNNSNNMYSPKENYTLINSALQDVGKFYMISYSI